MKCHALSLQYLNGFPGQDAGKSQNIVEEESRYKLHDGNNGELDQWKMVLWAQ